MSTSSSSDEKNTAAVRQAFIQSVIKRDHSLEKDGSTSPRASPVSSFFNSSRKTGSSSPNDEISTLFESFSTSAASVQSKSQEGSDHLLASLNSARDSIQSLEMANKDLLDALASRNSELEKVKAESYEWQNKHDALNGTVGVLRREIEALQLVCEEKDKLLAARGTSVDFDRKEVELIRKQYTSMQAAVLNLAGQINDIRDESEISPVHFTHQEVEDRNN